LAVRGSGGHSGVAHESRDAVFAAAQLVGALQSIVARETSPQQTLVSSVASIAGGEACNVVAGEVILRGTLRWLDRSERERALTRVDQIAAGVCAALRVAHTLRIVATVPVLRCAGQSAVLLADAASQAGADVIDPGVVPAGDDFANIAEHVPAGFIAVGAGGEGCGAHHAPDFDLDERAIGLITEILATAALTRLSGH